MSRHHLILLPMRNGHTLDSVLQLGIFLSILRPALTARFIIFLHIISVFVFSDSWWPVQCLQICAHVFIDRPHNCGKIVFRLRPGLCPNFGRSREKACPIFCRLRTKCIKLRPNFGRSCARLCQVSFAPCPFSQPTRNTAAAGWSWCPMSEILRTRTVFPFRFETAQ